MDLNLKAVILGIIEGVTEFLPVSSTGHLIIGNQFINFSGDFANMFDIVIQLGAILSVIVFFWNRLFPFSPKHDENQKNEIWENWKKSIVGVFPALLIGGVLGHKVEELFFNPLTVAVTLFIGGVILIALESRGTEHSIDHVKGLNYYMVLAIGFMQCLAMIPGVSRSAATIIGAMLLGASRAVAAEFSFFLAIPTMGAATAYSFLKHRALVSMEEWIALGIGFCVSFFVAWGVIKFFMNFIRKNDFRIFGYYRIALASAIGIMIYTNFLKI